MSPGKKTFSRRKFIVRSAIGMGVVLGSGYLVAPTYKRKVASTIDKAEGTYLGKGLTPPLWFEVRADNQIVLYSPKVEMGQGTLTGLAQLAADELEVSLAQIQVVHASTATGNIDQFSTGGSTSISGLWQPLRELAATMREMLKNEAARILAVPVSELEASNGQISNGKQTISYGEVVAQTTEWTIPKTPALKPRQALKQVGQAVPRLDLRPKVTGAPIFGIDAVLPDMHYGAILRPEKIGASLVNADTSQAEKMPGVVKIVKAPDFVGVIADTYTNAENAKAAIRAEWATDRNWQTEDLQQMIQVGKGKPVSIQQKGKPGRLLKDSEAVIRAEFASPIGAHAQLEPNGALAYVEADRATVILSTQVIDLTRKEVARRLGMSLKQVDIQPTYLGGGFGRRLHTPHAAQVALLSKAVGKPVKCFFSRKEEFQHDTFRPPTHHLLKAKLTETGTIEALEHNVSSGDVMYGSALLPPFVQKLAGSDVGAWRGGMIQYGAIPHYEAISWRVKLPFATSWWRSLGLLANTFAIESFMDELALKAGKDPVQFRLEHIQDDARGRRLQAVIRAVAEKAHYQDQVINGRAMGFACSTDVNTPCAQIAEVSIEAGRIKVHKVTCAIDPGIAVNPDQIRAQCEGSIIMGMSAAMYEQMEVVDGQLQPIIYGPYRMATLREAPKEIEVVILENDNKPGGVGEPPLGPIGAAIANAAFRLTGNRMRKMPLEG